MNDIRVLCWNVNGIRAVANKGFLEWLDREQPDILCLQETKARPDQLDKSLLEPTGYYTYWNYPDQKKGYSGVAIYTREKPVEIYKGLGREKYDEEGRVLIAEYAGFTLLNIYFPKGDTSPERMHRLQYKLDFYEEFLNFADSLKIENKRLIICGDFNTAHKEIDLARPKANEKTSGFLPEERAWIDKFVEHGYVDIFRKLNHNPDQYTWWDFKTGARDRNVGWRIDYFFVTDNLIPAVSEAFIMTDVTGSDHCPIGITINI
jgi:exodeoxyribonuclease-3